MIVNTLKDGTKFSTRIVKLIVLPEGDPVFSERATTVEIVDEAAGEFVTVMQDVDGRQMTIRLDCNEWPAIRQAIDTIVSMCQDEPLGPQVDTDASRTTIDSKK